MRSKKERIVFFVLFQIAAAQLDPPIWCYLLNEEVHPINPISNYFKSNLQTKSSPILSETTNGEKQITNTFYLRLAKDLSFFYFFEKVISRKQMNFGRTSPQE